MTTPETATCACGHFVVEHQLVTRSLDVGYRRPKARMRERAKPVARREFCTRCECKAPK